MRRLALFLILALTIFAEADSQRSFNAGELSPFMLRRIGFDKYDSGLQELTNFTIRVEGPVSRRPGTKFIAETETMSEQSLLISFEQSKTDAYVIECGDKYMRFYRNSGQIVNDNDSIYEIDTVFEEEELFDIQYVQEADVMYLVDGNDPPQKLSRVDHNDWTITDMNFTTGPFLNGNISTTTIEPNGVTGTITLIADSNIFDEGHVGALWRLGFRRTDNPLIGTLDGDANSVTMEISGSYYYNIQGTWEGDVIFEKSYDAGVTYETVYPRYNKNTAINEDFDDSEPDENVIYRVTMENHVSGSAEYYLKAAESTNYGIVRITDFNDANEVIATVLSELEDTNSTTLWSEGAWSDYRGWPQTIEFYEQRLMFGGSTSYPQTIWTTKTASGKFDDYENMTAGVDADDALIYVLSGQNPIQWMRAQTQLLIGTLSGVGRWGSSDDETAITPTDPTNYREQAKHGSAYMQSIMVGDAVLFVERGGHKVREFSYSLERDKYVAPDMTVLAEHITGDGIIDIAYQARPQPILWCVLEDGDIAALTYQRTEEVVGWSRYETDGDFVSVSTIPGDDEDEVWVIVKRDINDTDVRYVEQFQPQDWGSDNNDMFFVDAGLTFDGGAAVNITDITNADPAVVTTATAHGFSDGDQVFIEGIVGLTSVNDAVYSVNDVNVTDMTFALMDVTYTSEWDTNEIDHNFNTELFATQSGSLSHVHQTIRPACSFTPTGVKLYVKWAISELLALGTTYMTTQISIFNTDTGTNMQIFQTTTPMPTFSGEQWFTFSTFQEVLPATELTAGTSYTVLAEIATYGMNFGSPVQFTSWLGYSTENYNRGFFTDANNTDFPNHDLSFAILTDEVKCLGSYISGGRVWQVERDFTDANHLNGETVTVLADGEPDGTATVSDGVVHIDKWANKVVIGLPYTSALKTMPIIVPQPTGLSTGKIARISSVTIDFLDSLGVKFGWDEDNLSDVKFWEGRSQGLYTGWRPGPFMRGFARDPIIYMESAEPLPFTVRAISPNITITER